MAEILSEDLNLFESQRASLLEKSEGKFVLIHDDEVMGIYDSEQDAIREGYKHLGNVPFLVKRIATVEVPLYFTSNLIKV